MPWLQIKGDPSVRGFLFQQKRAESLFDKNMDWLLVFINELLCYRGVFHAKIHFSSNQLTCWMYNDPYRYQVYVGEEIFEQDFMERFDRSVYIEKPVVPEKDVMKILKVFKRLRMQDETVYLRNASINRINGKINLTFSCDGAHYLDYSEFYQALDLLWTDDDKDREQE